jgi:hypothetical protein
MIAAIAEARIPRAKPANSSIPAIQRCLCPQSITKTFFGAAEASLRPGTPVSRIDDAIRAALRAAGGYETTMGHQSGPQDRAPLLGGPVDRTGRARNAGRGDDDGDRA